MHRHSGCFYYFYSKLPSMKKLLLILFVNVIAWQTGSAQTKSDLYLICNSLPIDSVTEGVGRYEDIRNDNDSIYDHRPISFLMVSRSKDIRIWFDHYCFNTNERRKIVAIDRTDQLKIIYKPRSFLKTIEQAKPIRLEDRLEAFEINEEAWLWAKTLAGKILYLLDRNCPVNSAENGYGPTIKLIQVNLGSTNKREQELFFHEIHNRFLP